MLICHDEKCGFTKLESKEVSAPTIAECPIALECRVTEVVPLGSHDCFVADIVSVSCREDILENGRICYDKADLLAYAHGEYFALGEKLGRFGFSTDKRKKAEPEAVKPKAKEKTAREASLKPSDEPKKKQSSKPKKRGKKPFKKPQKSSIKL